MLFTATRRDGPDLAGLKGIGTNAVFALQFWSRDKLFHAIGPHHVAEVRITEFRRADTLLLFLDATPCLHGDMDGPLDVLINSLTFTRIEELEQSAHGFIDRIGIAPRQSATEEHPVLQYAHSALITKLAPTLGQEIAHQTEVIRQQLLADLGNIPAGQKGVDSVHESRIVFHLGWHGAK